MLHHHIVESTAFTAGIQRVFASVECNWDNLPGVLNKCRHPSVDTSSSKPRNLPDHMHTLRLILIFNSLHKQEPADRTSSRHHGERSQHAHVCAGPHQPASSAQPACEEGRGDGCPLSECRTPFETAARSWTLSFAMKLQPG